MYVTCYNKLNFYCFLSFLSFFLIAANAAAHALFICVSMFQDVA